MIDPKVKKYSEELKKLGIEHKILEHPQLKNVKEVQDYLGLALADGFSTLVFKAEDRYISLLRRDDCKVNFDTLKNLLGVKDLRMLTEEEFSHLTGLEPGAAQAYVPNVQTYLDQKLFGKEYLTGGSGSFTCSLRYKSEDLKNIPNSIIVDVAIMKTTEDIASQIQKKKRIVSGITPSGDCSLHIANYLGAVKQFITLAKSNDCFLFVADLHALTTVQNQAQLQHNVETVVLNELALLGDLTNITFFRQSDIPLHTELQSILNNVTPLGLIKRAHAYKDKLQKQVTEDEVNMGLFNYPILMAADILLYKPDLVPVGRDQKQHVEICRDIAGRFNKTFKVNVFSLPSPFIPEEVAVILGTDGKRKMSKSLGNIISIFETEETIRKQVMSTYTDPTRIHPTDPGHVEGNMVFSYLDFFGEKAKVDELKNLYTKGKISDVEVKNYLFDCLMKTFAPARKRYQELQASPDTVREILETGAKKAREVAGTTMKEVRDAVGLTNSYSFFSYFKLRNVCLPPATRV